MATGAGEGIKSCSSSASHQWEKLRLVFYAGKYLHIHFEPSLLGIIVTVKVVVYLFTFYKMDWLYELASTIFLT